MAVLSLVQHPLENLLTAEQFEAMRLLGLDEGIVWAGVRQWLQGAEQSVLQGLQGLDMTLFLAVNDGQPTEALLMEMRLQRWRNIWETAGFPDSHYSVLFPLLAEAGLPRDQWVRAMQQIRFWCNERAAKQRRDLIARLLMAGAWHNHIMEMVSPAPSLDEWGEVGEGLDIPVFPRSVPEADSHALYRAWEQSGHADGMEALLVLAEQSGHSFAQIARLVGEWRQVRQTLAAARSNKRAVSR